MMLDGVESQPFDEQVPMSYCIDKAMLGCSHSRGWVQREVITQLSRELRIVKVHGRYMCSRRRVDATNSKLALCWDYDTM